VGGWVGVKAVLRIAYSNQKFAKKKIKNLNQRLLSSFLLVILRFFVNASLFKFCKTIHLSKRAILLKCYVIIS
jgi:hypothetical protein